MRHRKLEAISLGVVLALTACGRATLVDLAGKPSSSGGASSSTSSSGTGGAGATGGTGGTGGTPCPTLVLAGPAVEVDSEPWGHEQRPALVASDDDGAVVTLAFEWMPIESPGPVPTEVRHVSFEAWGEWPTQDVGPSYLASSVGGHSFAAGQSAGDDFALLYTHGTPNASAGVSFSELVTPGANGAGSQIEIAPQGLRSLLAAYSGQATHLVGIEQPGAFVGDPPDPPASYELAVAVVHTPPSEYFVDGPHVVGCVDSPVVADGLRVDGGWLIARAMDDVGCSDDVPPGPATEVNVSYFADNGSEYYGAKLTGSEPVHWVGLARRSSGAWIAWRRSLPTTMGSIEAARLDATGNLVAGPFVLTDPNTQASWMAVAGLGDSLALIWIDTGVWGQPLVTAEVFGDGGELLASAPVPVNGYTGGEPAILSSPDGDSFVVAWTVQDADDIGDDMFVARFDCVEQ